MKNLRKFYWYLLVLSQVIMWVLLFLTPYFMLDDLNPSIFLFFMSFSSSFSFWLNYMFFLKKENISKSKTLIILSITWFVTLLFISAVLLFGYVFITLLFCWFLFTLIYIGKKYVFQ